jgi:hypothetical protein
MIVPLAQLERASVVCDPSGPIAARILSCEGQAISISKPRVYSENLAFDHVNPALFTLRLQELLF